VKGDHDEEITDCRVSQGRRDGEAATRPDDMSISDGDNDCDEPGAGVPVPAARRALNDAFAQRIRAGRDRLSRRLGREVTHREMAGMLSRVAGFTVSADDYHKYENGKELMPNALFFHFVELTDTTVDALPAPVDPGMRNSSGR